MLTTRKAQELDVVELTEDLPEFGLKKGERGAVVVAFDNPDEAYDLEFVDESGKSRFAYAVKPNQIRSTDELLREEYDRGMKLLNEGNLLEAEESFKKAVELEPESLGNLHNSILDLHKAAVKGTGDINELESLISGLRFVLRINPAFNLARYNMAVVYLNHGFQQAIQGDINAALGFYTLALGIESPPEVVLCLKNNFASAYTVMSVQSQQSGNLEKALQYSLKACKVNPNEMTRHNLGACYANLGWAYLNKGDFQTAGRLLQQAQDTGLVAPQLFNNYGIVLAALGHLDLAIQALEQALDLAPEDEVFKSNLVAIEKVKMKLVELESLTTRIAGIIPISPIEPFQAAA